MTADLLLEAVAQEARPRILAHFDAASCIATARIIIDVLGYFGIPAVPLPVETIVFNADAWHLLNEGGPAMVAAAVQERDTEELGGPWTVGLGVIRDPEAIGHVVVAVPSLNAVVDASIDQASRPHKNIVLTRPIILHPEAQFLAVPGVTAEVTLDEDGLPVTIAYMHIAHRRFERSPNWRRRSDGLSNSVFREITGETIRAVRDRRIS